MYAAAFLLPELVDEWGPVGLFTDQEQESLNVPCKYFIGSRCNKHLEVLAQYGADGTLVVDKFYALYQALRAMTIKSHPTTLHRALHIAKDMKFRGQCSKCKGVGHYASGCPLDTAEVVGCRLATALAKPQEQSRDGIDFEHSLEDELDGRANGQRAAGQMLAEQALGRLSVEDGLSLARAILADVDQRNASDEQEGADPGCGVEGPNEMVGDDAGDNADSDDTSTEESDSDDEGEPAGVQVPPAHPEQAPGAAGALQRAGPGLVAQVVNAVAALLPNPVKLTPLVPTEVAEVQQRHAQADPGAYLLEHHTSPLKYVGVTATELEDLQPREWLNDKIMEVYCLLLAKMAKQRGLNVDVIKNSFFYSRLASWRYKYDDVKSWTRVRRGGLSYLSHEKLMVPINKGANHWVMAIINFSNKRIEYYDSLPPETNDFRTNVFRNLRSWLADESLDKMKQTFNFDGWVDYAPSNIPHQDNGYDCGVFALKFAHFAALGVDLESHPFCQSDIDNVRSRMEYELLIGSVG